MNDEFLARIAEVISPEDAVVSLLSRVNDDRVLLSKIAGIWTDANDGIRKKVLAFGDAMVPENLIRAFF